LRIRVTKGGGGGGGNNNFLGSYGMLVLFLRWLQSLMTSRGTGSAPRPAAVACPKAPPLALLKPAAAQRFAAFYGCEDAAACFVYVLCFLYHDVICLITSALSF